MVSGCTPVLPHLARPTRRRHFSFIYTSLLNSKREKKKKKPSSTRERERKKKQFRDNNNESNNNADQSRLGLRSAPSAPRPGPGEVAHTWAKPTKSSGAVGTESPFLTSLFPLNSIFGCSQRDLKEKEKKPHPPDSCQLKRVASSTGSRGLKLGRRNARRKPLLAQNSDGLKPALGT